MCRCDTGSKALTLIVTACTTGLHCIGDAGRMIEYGDADDDRCPEATVSPLGIGGFAVGHAGAFHAQ